MSNQGYCANEIMFCFEICSCRERLSHFVLASVTGRRRLGFICNAQNSCTACSQPRFPAPKELDAKVMGNFSLYPPSLPQAKPLQTSLTSRSHTELPQAFLGGFSRAVWQHHFSSRVQPGEAADGTKYSISYL